ncbi:hypothetical protein J437_LFUL011006 [Ladona fulva]|uniref:Integrase zinc-binding domain-containing protein n=1 Tax=Ladona fulva TaxID=123851 RepID=A0A8K0P8T5_LADFU|nr:hypothetical protein J437_LFUL011006 [Ladona fulva]
MLQKMRKRFLGNSSFYAAYNTFMQEYHDLGQMRVVSGEGLEIEIDNCFFLPHHGVLKESSNTTKLRVVFNGSFKTNVGTSLNDVLYVGPNLLPELSDVRIRWRRYKIDFVSDIEKMYRQIRLYPYQSIVWRADKSLPINIYISTTFTYGLNSSPYIANRTLKQLADDEEVTLHSYDQKHPLIIPGIDKLTTIIINTFHILTLHGGTQITLTTIYTNYWVMKGRQAVKAAIQRCIPCLR